jgi:cell wall-associated NlpC family hydrolase
MTEEEARKAIVAEAKTWVGTPYISNGLVKGPRGGTDCAMLLIGVYGNVGLIPKEFDPRPYPPQWHVHRNEEKYLTYVLGFVKEIEGPPKPGDLAMFKVGLVFAHGAIVTDWPNVIHALGNDQVVPEDISKSTIGKRALARVPQRFFSFWS